jgi:hypothetical protein
MKIICRTLFDITRTDVTSRRNRLETDSSNQRERLQQSNFDTIIQVISMRIQPEDISYPEKTMISLKNSEWGTKFTSKSKIPMWQFEFTVSNIDVFNDGITQLGHLQRDCLDVPMITNLDEWGGTGTNLHMDSLARNIVFEVVHDEESSNI